MTEWDAYAEINLGLHWEVTLWELFATSRPLVEICPKRVSAKRCVGAAAGQTFQVWPLPKRRQARGGRLQQGPIAEHEAGVGDEANQGAMVDDGQEAQEVLGGLEVDAELSEGEDANDASELDQWMFQVVRPRGPSAPRPGPS